MAAHLLTRGNAQQAACARMFKGVLGMIGLPMCSLIVGLHAFSVCETNCDDYCGLWIA